MEQEAWEESSWGAGNKGCLVCREFKNNNGTKNKSICSYLQQFSTTSVIKCVFTCFDLAINDPSCFSDSSPKVTSLAMPFLDSKFKFSLFISSDTHHSPMQENGQLSNR